MRMMPTHYGKGMAPARVKAGLAEIKHFAAPIKGLSLENKLSPVDQMTAIVLRNFLVEEDRISARAGYRKLLQLADNPRVETIIPHYATNQVAAAAGGSLWSIPSGAALAGGFAGNDWSWTAFSNLSAVEYTVMVNGRDGVWSWNGTTVVQETITVPAGTTHIDPDAFHVVLSHQNRLWFADQAQLSVFYLPLQQKAGEVIELPLNAIFKRGGGIRAMYTWAVEGAANMSAQIAIFTTNGEVAIYNGTDPDTPEQFQLTGVYRFDSPMSKNSVANYGGDLYVLISTGVVPMSTLMRAESEQLGKSDKNVTSDFRRAAQAGRNRKGWQLLLDHTTGQLICNMPSATTAYSQKVRFMPNPIWADWTDVPARCWGWLDNVLYFGSDAGGIYEMREGLVNDDGRPMTVDVMWSWSMYGNVNQKQFKMLRPYFETDGTPKPYIQISVDYDRAQPVSQPEISYGPQGSDWDTATWDSATWDTGTRALAFWTGASALGRIGAARLMCSLMNCQLEITGIDVLFEEGYPV